METQQSIAQPINNVGYSWKLLVGFAISIFVIIVIALVTIGVITKGSFVFEKSPSPTLAPTKAPTLITSPPTMPPITSPPTFSPTFAPTPSPTMAPITSPPITSQPTMAPITSPPTTLYTRYQSECYVPQISEGISNTMTAAIVRSLGGYEPPGSSNNYIFEVAYGEPYIPNVRDPENAPVTQAPGIEGDGSIYIKLEFYKNTNMYNQFETAAADIMKQLGDDNTVMIMKIIKSLTPTAEAFYGEGYILIFFCKLSSIDFNDLILERPSTDEQTGFKFKVLQSLPTNTVTVLCPADSPASS
jgi:hypothetical protein